MSTTLTNGLKLPDKGSVDWYADMQNNYAILDGAVGTVAEHTSALSGKANAVHTHSKADVTDLFNSANTWTALNSYNQSIQITANFNIGAAPSSDVYGGFNFSNGTSNIGNITSRINSSGATYSRLYIGNKFANEALDPNGTWKYVELQVGLRANGDRFIYTDAPWRNSLIPYDNTYNLGSSTNQWNNLYAKNYFYNGTAWGLDKSNTWSGNNTFSGTTSFTAANININSSNFSLGDTVSNNQVKRFQWYDASSNRYACIAVNYTTDKSVWVDMPLRTKNTEGTSFVDKGIRFQVKPDNTSALLPINNSATDLGTSTNKWKSLNGINPGALSLPNLSRKSSILEYITDLTGGLQYYTPLADGWICIQADNSSATNYIRCAYDDILVKANGNGQAQGLSVLIPVLAGVQIGIRVVCTTLSSAYFYHCQGNVT